MLFFDLIDISFFIAGALIGFMLAIVLEVSKDE